VRIVLDTNILIGALITKGTPPDQLYQAWLRGEIELVTSAAQIAEGAAVLARPRLKKYLDVDEAAAILENIDTRALILDAPPDVNLSLDPQGQPYLGRGNSREGRLDRLRRQETRACARLSRRHPRRHRP